MAMNTLCRHCGKVYTRESDSKNPRNFCPVCESCPLCNQASDDDGLPHVECANREQMINDRGE